MFLSTEELDEVISRHSCFFYSPFEEGGTTAGARASVDFVEGKAK